MGDSESSGRCDEGSGNGVEQVVQGFLQLFDSIRLVAPGDEYPGVGCSFLADVVRPFVEEGRPICVVLPAFPAKSPNVAKKVLGCLPDRGEELALGLLEQFCRDVECFYTTGAEVVIFSDGRVFSDLLAISAETVDAYQKECERMATDYGYTHLKFDNLENHLAKAEHCLKPGTSRIDQAVLINKLLEEYGTTSDEEKTDANILNLHKCIKCFLRLDLEPSQASFLSEELDAGASQKRLKEAFNKKCGEVAKSMILRNMAFSKLVNAAHPGVVRISIHAHINAGPKFGVCLIPGQGGSSTPHTPWHNVVVETSDGQVQLMRREMVDMSKFAVYDHPIYERPWGFKEKNALINADTLLYQARRVEDIQKLVRSATGSSTVVNASDVEFLACLPIEIKLLHPCGIIIHCMSSASLTPLAILPDTLRRLTMQFGVAVLRGFKEVESSDHGSEELVTVAAQVGEIVYWTNFGAVLDVKELPGPAGSVMSSQALAFHWDGAFKFHNSQLQEIAHADTPGFILFQCVKPPAQDEKGGETLLTDTRLILRSGKLDIIATSDLASLEAEYYSPASGYFGGRWVQHMFVTPHPVTGESTLRYLEPWPESKSAKQWTKMRAVREIEAAMVEEASELVLEQIYDDKLFCYKHSWEVNDFMFVDNHAVLHGRTSFTNGSERHIRRIHFN